MKSTAKFTLFKGRGQFSALPWPLLTLQHSSWAKSLFSAWLHEEQGGLTSPKPLLAVLSSLWIKCLFVPGHRYLFLTCRSLDPGAIKLRRVKATGCRCQLEMEKGLASIIIVPWPRQDSLPLTQAVKPYANSSWNPALFKTTAEKKKKKQLLRGHQGMAEIPIPAKAGKPQGGGDQNGSIVARARCSLALGFWLLTHEAQMAFRVKEKGALLTQAMPYFSKYHMPSRHFGLNPASVRLRTWLLQQTANSFCAQCMPKTELSQADTHFVHMILIIPGTKRWFPTLSNPASASTLGSSRKS